MKRKILFIVLILVLLGFLGIVYLNRIFFPIKLKAIVIQKAEELLNRKVTFEAIRFDPIQGFVVSDINIWDKDHHESPLLRADELSFSILYLPVLREKKIIIPQITLIRPAFHLSRESPTQWNISDLISKLQTPSGSAGGYSFFCGGLSLVEGEVTLLDKTIDPPFPEVFEGISLKANFSLPKGLRFLLEAAIPKSSSSIAVEGESDFSFKNLTGQLTVHNIYPSKYFSLYLPHPPFLWDKGVIKTAELKLKRSEEKIHAQGSLELDEIDLAIPGQIRMQGHLKAPDLILTLGPQKALELKANFWIRRADLQFPDDKNIRGDIKADGFLISLHPGGKAKATGSLTIQGAELQWDALNRLAGQVSLTAGVLNLGEGRADFTGQLKVEDLLQTFGEGKSLSGQLIAGPLEIRMHNEIVTLKANANLIEAKVNWGDNQHFQGNITADNLSSAYGHNTFYLESDLSVTNALLQWGAEKTLQGNFNTTKTTFRMENKRIDAQSDIRASQARLTWGLKKTLSGDPQLTIDLSYHPDDKTPLRYHGTLSPNITLLTGIPYVQEIKDVLGQIEFKTNQANVEKLTLVSQQTPVQLSGRIVDFSDPFLDVLALAEDVDLRILPVLFPEVFEKIKVAPSGKAKVNLQFRGKASSLSDAFLGVTAQLNEATVKTEHLRSPLTDLQGEITYTPEGVSWKEVQGNFENYDFLINGQLNNFSQPVVKTYFRSQSLGLDVNGQTQFLGPNLKIDSLKGRYLNSSFDVKGELKEFQSQNPEAHLTGHITLDLKDLSSLGTSVQNHMEKLKPSGTLAIDASLDGKLKDWLKGKLNLSAKSPEVSLSGYKIEDVSLKWDQSRGQIDQLDITARLYDGRLRLESSADLNLEEMPYRLEAHMDDTNLEKLKADTVWKNKEIRGILSGFIYMNGSLRNLTEIEANGRGLIKEGYLWQLDLLKGLGRLLLIEELGSIVFREAGMDFKIKDQKLLTNNLILKSEPLVLSGQGSLDFEGKLNFDIMSEFNPEMIAQSESLKRTITSIMARTGQYLHIKITGSLQDPRFALIPLPVNVIEKTKELLWEGLRDIF